MNERDAILEVMQELPDWEDPPTARWPNSDSGYNNADFQLSPTQPVARRLKAAPIVQVKSPPARIERYSGVRLSQNNKLLPSFNLPSSLWCTPHIQSDVSNPLSFKTLSPDSHAQHGGGLRQSCRRICCENPCRDSEGGVQLVDSLLKTVFERRKRSASPVRKTSEKVPRRTMIQQNMTRRRPRPVTGAPNSSSSTNRSAATQTTNSATDKGLLQQWRSIQGKYWLELHRLQHRIQQIITQTRDPNRKLPDRTLIAVLEQLRDRINSISKQKLQCGCGNWLRAPVA